MICIKIKYFYFLIKITMSNYQEFMNNSQISASLRWGLRLQFYKALQQRLWINALRKYSPVIE